MSGVVTLDVLSALTDSHRGATTFLAGLTSAWPVTPAEVARDWDARTKELHRTTRTWRSHADLATEALVSTYASLGVERDAQDDAAGLLASLADWPLWPDVAALEPSRGTRCGWGC